MALMFQDLARDAYIKNGLQDPTEPLDPQYSDYALREANRLLDQWNVQANFVWTTVILTFPLTARTLPTYWYTIGPAGSLPGPSDPDFIAPRPTRIKRANLLLEQSSPASRVPLKILDALQWSDQTVPQLGTTIPTSIYDDYANPASRLYIWPYPTTTLNQIELFVWNQIARFASLTDEFVMPPGYEDAFMLTLSERCIEGIGEVTASLATAASRARANIKSLNSRAPKISTTDSGMPGRNRGGPGDNFYAGWPTYA